MTPHDIERFWAKVDRSGGPDACWPWTAGRYRAGYGHFRINGKMERAHRVAWVLLRGPIPEGQDVLHTCDSPPCCNAERHHFLGTDLDNAADRVAKGRSATGARNGAYTHPERRSRVYGERHGTHTHPERRARGERHGSRTHPERLARGDRSGARRHPERLARGECVHQAKLTADQVLAIRTRVASGGRVTQAALAREYGVGQQTISKIVRRERWAHVT